MGCRSSTHTDRGGQQELPSTSSSIVSITPMSPTRPLVASSRSASLRQR